MAFVPSVGVAIAPARDETADSRGRAATLFAGIRRLGAALVERMATLVRSVGMPIAPAAQQTPRACVFRSAVFATDFLCHVTTPFVLIYANPSRFIRLSISVA